MPDEINPQPHDPWSIDVEATVKGFMAQVDSYETDVSIEENDAELVLRLKADRDRVNTELAHLYAEDIAPRESLSPQELLENFDEHRNAKEQDKVSSKRELTLNLASFLYQNDLISDDQKCDMQPEDIHKPISKKRRFIGSVLLDKYNLLQGISFGVFAGSMYDLANKQLNEGGIVPIESPRNAALTALGVAAAIATRNFSKKANDSTASTVDEIRTETVLEIGVIGNIVEVLASQSDYKDTN